MKYYLDTCIWIDYFENRCDRFRPLGEWALMLINKIIADKEKVVFSDILLDELKVLHSDKKVDEIVNMIPKEQVILIISSDAHWQAAGGIARRLKIPINDVVHALIAKENGAVFVSRDKHFILLDFIEFKKPEELI